VGGIRYLTPISEVVGYLTPFLVGVRYLTPISEVVGRYLTPFLVGVRYLTVKINYATYGVRYWGWCQISATYFGGGRQISDTIFGRCQISDTYFGGGRQISDTIFGGVRYLTPSK